MRIGVILLVLSAASHSQWWSVQTSGLDTNLRGVSVSHAARSQGHFVVWASGSKGVVLRSTDDGRTWQQLHVAGGDDLDFRDVEGFGADAAYVMSSGEGDKSRVYKTIDGGATWKLQYTDKRPGFFLDSLACDSKTHCVGLSDPVDGKFLVLRTDDGEHWQELPRDKMPAALGNEGAFAASGTAITLCDGGAIYFGTGGGKTARVFRSRDRGRTWVAVETPIAAGNPSSGIFSVACRGHALVAVGGDYKSPTDAKQTAAYSTDQGATWHLAERQPAGYRSGAACLSRWRCVAVGTGGTDIAEEEHGGATRWKETDSLNLNAVCVTETGGWAVGANGTIARFSGQRSGPEGLKPKSK